MSKHFFVLSFLLLLGAGLLFRGPSERGQKKRIGVVVPVEHQAMDAILSGFKGHLLEKAGEDIVVEVQNAQGDLTIQRAMIEKFARQNVDLIATIGTDLSLTAINLAPRSKIVGIDVTEQVDQDLSPNITGVKESSIEPSYRFIRESFPEARKIAMIYSASDKNYQMVKRFSSLANQDDLKVQEVMVHSMADLYLLAKSIDQDIDLIFIAKDHLVASGAPILSQVADELEIPFFTSDEGSVIAGGTISLGNRESDIGRAGGNIALKLLNGETPREIPIQPVQEMTLFINSIQCQKRGIAIDRLNAVAAQFNYSVELIEGKL